MDTFRGARQRLWDQTGDLNGAVFPAHLDPKESEDELTGSILVPWLPTHTLSTTLKQRDAGDKLSRLMAASSPAASAVASRFGVMPRWRRVVP